jgi:8-oxo-dGTP pyrophosphatase MutT (NUDIX family)
MSLTLSSLDPRFLRVRRALEITRPPEEGADPVGGGEGRMRAAVALVLRGGPDLDLLLIKRAVSERDPWSGHMAFPGGRLDPSDASLLDTAVRETREETGILLDPAGRLLGSLDPVSPSTRRLPPLVIAPFVFGAEAGVEAVPEPLEVERTLWVPLAELRDPAVRRVVPIPMPGGEIPFPAFVLGEHVIWGLTYRILDRFLQVVAEP